MVHAQSRGALFDRTDTVRNGTQLAARGGAPGVRVGSELPAVHAQKSASEPAIKGAHAWGLWNEANVKRMEREASNG